MIDMYPVRVSIAMINSGVTVETFNAYREMIGTDRHDEADEFFRRYTLRTDDDEMLDKVTRLLH